MEQATKQRGVASMTAAVVPPAAHGQFTGHERKRDEGQVSEHGADPVEHGLPHARQRRREQAPGAPDLGRRAGRQGGHARGGGPGRRHEDLFRYLHGRIPRSHSRSLHGTCHVTGGVVGELLHLLDHRRRRRLVHCLLEVVLGRLGHGGARGEDALHSLASVLQTLRAVPHSLPHARLDGLLGVMEGTLGTVPDDLRDMPSAPRCVPGTLRGMLYAALGSMLGSLYF
mmetsp:Transcript_141561/g.343848  ORF Transcript_141561/g.343848 Transcript_141561/m.343848 type:complete len:227 (-) Transcript_141561:206-886(-)